LPKYPVGQIEHPKPLLPEEREGWHDEHEEDPSVFIIGALPEGQLTRGNSAKTSTTQDAEPVQPPAKNTSPFNGSEAAAIPSRPTLRPVANAVHELELALYTSTTRE
jgi:hypothetical protein